ncbi:MAG TPA: DUF4296 domain-containing protein [Chitinophagaceae bacterium]
MRYLLLCLLILGASCSGKNRLPKNILSKEKMEAVMWDVMLADQYVSDFVFYKDTSLSRLTMHTNMYEEVFRLHKTSKDEFSRSFNYYRSHPALMKEVLDSLSVKKLPVTDTLIKIKPAISSDSLLKLKKKLAPKAIPAL